MATKVDDVNTQKSWDGLQPRLYALGMTMGDRIEELLRERGWSQGELARRVGVSTQAIWKLVKGNSNGSRYLHKIARELGTTAEYLSGESDEVNPLQVGDSRLSFSGFEREPFADPDAVEIDHLDLHLGLGAAYLDNHVEVVKRRFSRTWLRDVGVTSAPEMLAWAKGDGDSMEPTIRDGEVTLIDRSNVSPGMDDKIWAVAVGDVGMIKRLRVLPSGTIEIHSDNPQVPPATAHDGELHVLGRVVAVVRRL